MEKCGYGSPVFHTSSLLSNAGYCAWYRPKDSQSRHGKLRLLTDNILPTICSSYKRKKRSSNKCERYPILKLKFASQRICPVPTNSIPSCRQRTVPHNNLISHNRPVIERRSHHRHRHSTMLTSASTESNYLRLIEPCIAEMHNL
jgi:hypothetical protein